MHSPYGGIIVEGTEPHDTTNAKSYVKSHASWAA